MEHSSPEKAERALCAWCHDNDGILREITVTTRDRLGLHPQEQTLSVHPHHEADVRAFCDRYHRYGGRFFAALLVLTVSLTVAGVLPVFVGGGQTALPFIGAIMALEGVLFIALPFCTPETIRWLGLKRAVHLTRLLGGLIVAMGLFITAL